jgi:hypothetical protein
MVISSAESCADREVLLHVTANNLAGVTALTLKIHYTPENLIFKGLENISGQLGGMVVNITVNPPMIAVAWTNLVPENFSQNKLFELRFESVQLPGDVMFDQACEVADSNLEIIAVNFVNGEIVPGNPVVTGQPESQSCVAGNNVSFMVKSDRTAIYQWESSADSGKTWSHLQNNSFTTGADSEKLNLLSVGKSMDRNMYRCILDHEGCLTSSTPATLKVESASGEPDKSEAQGLKAWYMANEKKAVMKFSLMQKGNVVLSFFSVLGERIATFNYNDLNPGSYMETVSLSTYPPGIFLCRIDYPDGEKRLTEIRKILKLK